MDLKGAQPYLFPPKKPDPARLKHQREAEDHYQSGMALWRQNLTNQAIREFQKALILRPDHADTRKSLGAVLDAITRSSPPPGGGTNSP
jgi:Flp pilus assembly protein TadD